MNKMEYAMEIAKIVNGDVAEVDKMNGVKLIGIRIKNDNNITPTIYIDQMYDEDLSVYEAAEKIKEVYSKTKIPQVDLSIIENFEKAKDHLRARLVNGTLNLTFYDVSKVAPEPFDDLLIVPYLDGIIENGSCKITEGMLKRWDVTAEEVIRIAEENSSKDIKIQTMLEALTGISPDNIELPFQDEDANMWIVTNNRNCYGAYAVIPAKEKLRTMFPDGYTVLPSSVHEVIVVTGSIPKSQMDAMVDEVNHQCLNREDILSNIAYVIR